MSLPMQKKNQEHGWDNWDTEDALRYFEDKFCPVFKGGYWRFHAVCIKCANIISLGSCISTPSVFVSFISVFCEKLRIRLLAPEVWRSLISSPPRPIRKCNSLDPFWRRLSLSGRAPFHLKVKRCLPFQFSGRSCVQGGTGDRSLRLDQILWVRYRHDHIFCMSDRHACTWANKTLRHFKRLWNCQWIHDEMHST